MYQPKIRVNSKSNAKEVERQCCCNPQPILVCYDINNKLPVPLQKVNYNLKVLKGMTIVQIEQIYSTIDFEQPIDLEYIFTINQNAAVTKMKVELGDIKVYGIVKEKEEAKQEYEEGIKQGKTMAYCEQDEDIPEIKRVKLGQLAPKKQLKITFEYIQQLEVCLNKFWKVEVSPIVDENYVQQGKSNETYERQLFCYLNKFVTLSNIKFHFTQKFSILIDTGSKITFVKSPTHSLLFLNATNEFVKTQLDDQMKMQIALEDTPINFAPNKQFILLFSTDDINLPTAVLSHTNNDALQQQKYCATISFIPKFHELPLDDAYQQYLDKLAIIPNQKIIRGNYLFFIDRSGSMGGSRIAKAKQSLILFLKSLPDNCLFNIVSFGSDFQLMWDESQVYNQSTLDQALLKVKNIDADMGGTRILQTLQQVIYTKFYGDLKEQTLNVFLLTDGKDYPEPIINLVKNNNKAETRIYTLGIGEGCSQYLIKRVAEVGNGKYQFVSDNGDINEKVIDLLEDSITPYLSSFSIEYNNGDHVSQIIPDPSSIISVKKNEQVTVQVLFSAEQQLDKEQEIQIGFFDPQFQKQMKYSVNLNFNQAKENEYFHKLAAHKLISYYENAQKYGIEQLNFIKINKEQFQDQDIVNLSVEYQLLSTKTAFICEICDIEDQFKQQIKQKVQVTSVKQTSEKQQYPNDFMSCRSMPQPNACSYNQQYQRYDLQQLREERNLCAEVKRQDYKICQKPVYPANSGYPSANSAYQNNNSNYCGPKVPSLPQFDSFSPYASLLLPFVPASLSSQQPQDFQPLRFKNNCQSQESMKSQNQVDVFASGDQSNDFRTQAIKMPSLSYEQVMQYVNANGCFTFPSEILTQLKFDTVVREDNFDQQVWDTLFALLYLEILCKESKSIWQLVYQKGIQFLMTNGIVLQDLKSKYEQQVRTILQK